MRTVYGHQWPYWLLLFLHPLASSWGFSVSMTGDVLKSKPSVVYPQFFEALPSMKGKHIVVTGASKGLGYVTALSLAKKGAAVYLLNRRSPRAEDAHAAIAEACTGPEPVLVECDLLDFSSVRKAASVVKEAVPGGIDVLCCNAGVMLQPNQPSSDGYDVTISTNVLSHFLLTRELMPELEKAAAERIEARIVSMSSASGYGPPAFDARFFSRNGGSLGQSQRESYERYHQSKLANLLFTAALDEKLRAKNSPIKALACHPGVCATDMFVHAQSVFSNRRDPADMPQVPSAEDGAVAQLKCICDPDVQSGELFGPDMRGSRLPVKQPLSPPLVLIDDKSKERLWAVCEEAVGRFDV